MNQTWFRLLSFFRSIVPQEDKLDVSTPEMYSSFIPNGRPGPLGLSLGDPELNVSQVTTER